MTLHDCLDGDTLHAFIADTLASYAGLSIELQPDVAPTNNAWVAGSVQIDGTWLGTVTVALSVPLAAHVAQRMLRLTDVAAVTGADIDDAAGELANIVGGNVKALLPAPSALGLPSVRRLREVPCGNQDCECQVSLRAGSAGEPIVVTVHERCSHSGCGTVALSTPGSNS